jgi:hypothetical protein
MSRKKTSSAQGNGHSLSSALLYQNLRPGYFLDSASLERYSDKALATEQFSMSNKTARSGTANIKETKHADGLTREVELVRSIRPYRRPESGQPLLTRVAKAPPVVRAPSHDVRHTGVAEKNRGDTPGLSVGVPALDDELHGREVMFLFTKGEWITGGTGGMAFGS